MPKKILFEILHETKKELNEYLKRTGLSSKYVESLQVHFHPDGEISLIRPILRF